MYCSACGKQVGEAAAFCPACGHRVITVSQPANLRPQPAAKKPNRLIVLLCVFVIFALLIILAVVWEYPYGSPSIPANTSQAAAPPPKEDALTAKQHVAELRKLVSKHPLYEGDIAAIQAHVRQLQLRRADSEKTNAQLIAKAEDRLKWAEWRNKVEFDATVACRRATEAQLKAPDAVEWKGERAGWDPQRDWYYNVDLQANAMNSFGAKLRSVFYCQALCSEKQLPNGLHCLAVSVREP